MAYNSIISKRELKHIIEKAINEAFENKHTLLKYSALSPSEMSMNFITDTDIKNIDNSYRYLYDKKITIEKLLTDKINKFLRRDEYSYYKEYAIVDINIAHTPLFFEKLSVALKKYKFIKDLQDNILPEYNLPIYMFDIRDKDEFKLIKSTSSESINTVYMQPMTVAKKRDERMMNSKTDEIIIFEYKPFNDFFANKLGHPMTMSDAAEITEFSLRDWVDIKTMDDQENFIDFCEKIISFNEFKYFKNCKVIKKEGIADCIYMKEIEFPESLEYIEDYALGDCWNIGMKKPIIIPDNVKEIGHNAFTGEYNHKQKFSISSNTKYYEDSFDNPIIDIRD